VRILAVATAVGCLAGCTSMNIYQGADAATLSTVCGAEVRNEATGIAYTSYTTIFQIDGSFTGSGHGCPALYVYRIRPGSRSIKLAVNFDNPNDKFLTYGIVEAAAELSPGKNYQIQTYYSSGSIGVRFVETDSRSVAGSGQTAKIERSSKANAAVTALPLIVN
jgi:hypothetical protein